MTIQRRVIAGSRHGLLRRLRAMGLDFEAIQSKDADIAEAAINNAVHALKAIEKAMRKPAVWPTAPTPERRAKSEEIIELETQPGQPMAHRSVWPPDQMRDSLELAEHTAARRLAECYELLHVSQGVGSYGGSSGRSGERLELTERQQFAGQEFNAMWSRLPPILQQVAENFILEKPSKATDVRPQTWVEFGRRWGNQTSDQAARWMAKGALKSCCVLLAAGLRDFERAKGEAAKARRKVA